MCLMTMKYNYGTLAEPIETPPDVVSSAISIPVVGASSSKQSNTVSKLKDRLQERYETAYPALVDVIRHVIDQEGRNAQELSSLFPHLILPALVEIHMARVGLELPIQEPSPPRHRRLEADSDIGPAFTRNEFEPRIQLDDLLPAPVC